MIDIPTGHEQWRVFLYDQNYVGFQDYDLFSRNVEVPQQHVVEIDLR